LIFLFVCLFLWQTKNIFPNPYSFYLNAYLVSLEQQTFGYPLDSCPDALPVSHGELDASSTIF